MPSGDGEQHLVMITCRCNLSFCSYWVKTSFQPECHHQQTSLQIHKVLTGVNYTTSPVFGIKQSKVATVKNFWRLFWKHCDVQLKWRDSYENTNLLSFHTHKPHDILTLPMSQYWAHVVHVVWVLPPQSTPKHSSHAEPLWEKQMSWQARADHKRKLFTLHDKP